MTNIIVDEIFQLEENVKGIRLHTYKLVKARTISISSKVVSLLTDLTYANRQNVHNQLSRNRDKSTWNSLGHQTIDATSINSFKGKLEKTREKRMGFFMD